VGQKKLIRFAAIAGYPHVLQYPTGMNGQWSTFYKNTNPLTLELACGKGEYAVGLGRMHPERNFLGVDVKGNRIYIGAKQALTEGLGNVAFLRTQIDKIAEYFAPGEVSEIWLTFPDPQLRISRMKKRLTHPRYLRMYQQFLRPGGYIHLKTDSPVLYRFTKKVIGMYGLTLHEDTDNVFNQEEISPELRIRTHYEGLDIAGSSRIHYLRFSLPQTALPDLDEELYDQVRQEEDGGPL
jgi:tRNA (guanine-N7-)-methyltransferase